MAESDGDKQEQIKQKNKKSRNSAKNTTTNWSKNYRKPGSHKYQHRILIVGK